MIKKCPELQIVRAVASLRSIDSSEFHGANHFTRNPSGDVQIFQSFKQEQRSCDENFQDRSHQSINGV